MLNERTKQPRQLHAKKINQKGSIEGLVLLGIVAFSVLIGGGLFFNNVLGSAPSISPLAICCDRADCSPSTNAGETFLFQSPTNKNFPNPTQYGILKSNVSLNTCGKHLFWNGQYVPYPDGHSYKVIVSNSEELNGVSGECHGPGQDQMADFRSGSAVCFPIPDDELVLVCKSGLCQPPPAPNCGTGDPSGTTYFGDGNTVYDIYMRSADFPNPGAPEIIKNCLQQPYNAISPLPSLSPGAGNETGATFLFNSWPGHKTLQLHTFNFTQSAGLVKEPRFFCKPALYLYPQQSETVNVIVSPKGPLTYTDPPYPANGWTVTASPDGNISYQNKLYDYLYYETAIPDASVPKEKQGYVISYDKLPEFLASLLPKLGLNTKEQSQFIDYWLKALPNAPYYKIGIIPQTTLDVLAPLTITPHPDTTIRVTLNFEPTDKPADILPPVFPSVVRNGFTVVEWAGMFKKDKNHPFTCLQ